MSAAWRTRLRAKVRRAPRDAGLPRTSSLFGARRATAIVRAYYRGNRVAVGTGFLIEGISIFERGLELRVDLDLVAGDQLVGFVGHADHRLQFVEHRVGHAFATSGSGMRGDAVGAIIRHADRDVEHFFRERIKRARRHDLLDAFPGAL